MERVKVTAAVFEESARPLRNPNRGFYYIYQFHITDQETDYNDLVERFYYGDTETTLALVQINLKEYRAQEISPAGLKNIDALFNALAQRDKQLIVRFLYDWEQKNLLTEPASLDLILQHMEQLGEILNRYSDSIFTLHGLFVGDWGEMHSTRYESPQELRRLAQKLAEITGGYLSVRTPAQWRQITEDGADTALVARLGLFNDGILGSETDLGTYGVGGLEDQRRSRAEELAFQETLCCGVPNGGEVVIENPFNDFENAVRDLSAMHITYLNRAYDQEVMDKWAAKVMQSGCFQGVDGLSYIERHLGYRLLISGVKAEWKAFRNQIIVKVFLRNEGFAPVYVEPEMTIALRGADGSLAGEYLVRYGGLRELSGGTDSEKKVTLQAAISGKGLAQGHYNLYLTLEDPASGQNILLANTQDIGPYGYCLGGMEVYR